jgi:hypothetical protein
MAKTKRKTTRAATRRPIRKTTRGKAAKRK